MVGRSFKRAGWGMLSRIFINKRKRGREVGMVGSMLGGGHRCRMVRRAVIKLRRSRIPTTHLHLFYWKTCLWGNPTFAAKMLALIQFLDLACGGYIWDWAVSAFELEQPFVRSWEMKWERERKITFGAVQRMFFFGSVPQPQRNPLVQFKTNQSVSHAAAAYVTESL